MEAFPDSKGSGDKKGTQDITGTEDNKDNGNKDNDNGDSYDDDKETLSTPSSPKPSTAEDKRKDKDEEDKDEEDKDKREGNVAFQDLFSGQPDLRFSWLRCIQACADPKNMNMWNRRRVWRNVRSIYAHADQKELLE